VSTVKGSWAGRESDDGSDVEEDTGSGDGGTSRPATNITGASCTTNSGGYEFMLRSSLSEEARNGEVSRAVKTAPFRAIRISYSISIFARLAHPIFPVHIFRILFGGNPAVTAVPLYALMVTRGQIGHTKRLEKIYRIISADF
jgi:hypothetical protein